MVCQVAALDVQDTMEIADGLSSLLIQILEGKHSTSGDHFQGVSDAVNSLAGQ